MNVGLGFRLRLGAIILASVSCFTMTDLDH